MVGTKAGGAKASLTNKKKHGDDFYRRIGSKGGQASGKGGFAANPELARKAGAIGGARSKRGPAGEKKPKEYVWRPGDELFSR